MIVLCALMGNVTNQEMFVHARAHTTATNAVVIGSTIPVFTLLGALLLGRETLRLYRALGMACAFTGVMLLVGASPDGLSLSSDHFVGSVLVLINALSYGVFLVVVRPLATKYDLRAARDHVHRRVADRDPDRLYELSSTPALGRSDYGFLAFLIAVPTVTAYGLTQLALKRAESSLVAAYIYLQPIFAAVGAMLVLDEEIQPRTAACGAIVLFGRLVGG